MQKIMKTVRLSLIYLSVLLLTGSYPLSAMAEAADSTLPTATTSDTTTPPAPAPTTETSTSATPVATSADTAPSTMPSVAAPVSEPTKPKETYTYNEETGRWDSNRWQYNPETGKYERPPEPVLIAQVEPETVSSPAVVAPDTKGASKVQQSTKTVIDDTTKNAIVNAIESGALSGDAIVKGNTTAGSATTGDASSVATIINNVNSTVTNNNNQKAATFVSDVIGDVHGDIVLQPMLLKAMLEAGAGGASQGSTTTSTTNEIINDISLHAKSGNATVAGNTTAGNATTGDANTVANILNIVNSMVAANRSFVGTINIYGNLDGDILVAPDFIPQMLANNGSSTSSKSSAESMQISSKDTQTIVNNVALAAETGQALVAGNTTAGSATSGDANTNVILFNLTGHEIIASNSLLVFVNVLGKWVGVIVDAPTGATAAAIGNGVSSNTVLEPDLTIETTTNTLLTNNVYLTSQSGDATVKNNTMAGSATTGNATASANIGNIVGTRMGLSDWFGVLFINVFGSWNGSFGIDTASGNPTSPTKSAEPSANQPLKVIEFIPRNQGAASRHFTKPALTVVGEGGNGAYTATNVSDQPEVRLASATPSDDMGSGGPIVSAYPSDSQALSRLPLLGSLIFLAGLTLVGLSTFSDARKRTMQLR